MRNKKEVNESETEITWTERRDEEKKGVHHTNTEMSRYKDMVRSGKEVNESKTEITRIERRDEEYKSCVKKLGNLMNESKDIKRRKALAQNAFKELKNVWSKKDNIRVQKGYKYTER